MSYFRNIQARMKLFCGDYKRDHNGYIIGHDLWDNLPPESCSCGVSMVYNSFCPN